MTDHNPPTAADILKLAREKVAAGWTQGSLTRDAQGATQCSYAEATCYCSWGAILAASDELDLANPSVRLYAEDLFESTYAEPGVSLISWNDRPGRTQAEVVAAFDAAIVKAQERTK
jgi:hypothetical protein